MAQIIWTYNIEVNRQLSVALVCEIVANGADMLVLVVANFVEHLVEVSIRSR